MDTKLIKEEIIDKQIFLEDFSKKNLILQVYSGSIAYGTNNENSDIDIRGVFVDSLENILINKRVEQVNFKNDDTVYFELNNFLTQIKEQKPNALEYLWTDPKHIIYKNDLGEYLLSNREKLLSKKVIHSYIGYAQGELGRIKGHNKWINKPQPKEKPSKKDYFSVVWNLSENSNFNKNIPFEKFCAVTLKDNHFSLYENKNYSKHNSWVSDLDHILLTDKDKIEEKNPIMIVKFNEKLYDEAVLNWKNYWTWQKSRNAVRGKTEELYGYDTKNAMHLIRLLKTGIEVLETGKISVLRSDAQFLKDIRAGKYKYEEIIEFSNELTSKLRSLEKTSHIQKEIDYSLIDEISLEIYKNKFNINNLSLIKAKLI